MSTLAGVNVPAQQLLTDTLPGGASRDDVQRCLNALQSTMRAWAAQSTATAVTETWRLLRLDQAWVELAAFDCGDISDGDGRRWVAIRGHAVQYVRSAAEAQEAIGGNLGERGFYLVPARLVAGRETVYDAHAWSSAKNGTAKEVDVTWSSVLCVDADPERPSNTSATRIQWAAAVGVAGFVRETLLGNGLSEGAIGLGHSGNGAHVHIYLDVTWSPEVKALRERTLRALGVLCHYVSGPSARVKIDQTLADGARYIPLYGTLKRKGGRGHADRPWRQTAIVGPEVVTPLDIAALRRLADALEAKLTAEAIEFWEGAWRRELKKRAAVVSPPKAARPSTGPFPDIFDEVKKLPMRDVAAFLGLDISKCPRCASEKGAGITKHPAAGIELFHCFHDSCAAKPNLTNATLALHVKGIAEGDGRAAFDAVSEVARHFGIVVPRRGATKAAPPSKEERAETFKAVMSVLGAGGGSANPLVPSKFKAEPQTPEAGSIPEDSLECITQQQPGTIGDNDAVSTTGAVSATSAISGVGATDTAPTSTQTTSDDVDFDSLLVPIIDLDAIQQEKVISAISRRHGMAKGVLRERLAELTSERTPENDELEKADVLGTVLEHVVLVEATNCRVFANVSGEIVPADSPRLKARIAHLYNQASGERLGPTTIESALAPMLGADIPHRVVPIRSAYGEDGSIWIDLGTKPPRYAHVAKDAAVIKDDCPVSFYRPKTMAPMPTPVIPANDLDCRKAIEAVREHFQITREQLASAFVWAIGALRPGEPYAGGKLTEYVVLLVTGAQGSGKTTFADSWSETVDPKVTPHFKLPRDDEALAILAENTRALVFNNLSYIPQWTSDALCELADGSGMVLRSLYTNRDTSVFKGSNAVALVSIGDVALQPDLLDRSLAVALPERTEYVEPEQVEARFQELRPRLLGALLYCASRGLRDSATTTAPRGVRMAGAARWAVASASAGGFTREEIESAFAGAIHEADEQVLGHPLVVALNDIVTAKNPWSGTTKDLLTALTASHETLTAGTKKLPKRWPENPQGLRSDLRRLAKTLTRSGFTFTWPTGGGRGGRILTITRSAPATLEGDAPAYPDAPRKGVESMHGMCVEDADGNVVGPPAGDLGTIAGTTGTMPPSEMPHRSLEKNRGGNDGNDGNDATFSLNREKGEKPLEGGEEADRGLLSGDSLEDGLDIVPIVPSFPQPETRASGGTMPVPASLGIVPPARTHERTGVSDTITSGAQPPSLRAKVKEIRLERCPLEALVEPDAEYPSGHRILVEFETEIGPVYYERFLSRFYTTEYLLEQVMIGLGWGGERNEEGRPIVPRLPLLVQVRTQILPGYGIVPLVFALSIERRDQAA